MERKNVFVAAIQKADTIQTLAYSIFSLLRAEIYFYFLHIYSKVYAV